MFVFVFSSAVRDDRRGWYNTVLTNVLADKKETAWEKFLDKYPERYASTLIDAIRIDIL